MKKIILAGASIAALTMASPAFAQSSSTVNQDGDGNQADVGQTGSNTSTIDQVGNSNDADVTQSGTGNFSDIDQTGAGPNIAEVIQDPGTNGSFADIFQTGTSTGNDALIDQANTTGTVGQVFQTDSDTGLATVDQDGGSDNFTVIVQGDSTFAAGTQSGAVNADALVEQSGTFNEAIVVQTGLDQIATIDQTGAGTDNDATIFQGAFGGENNNAFILQIADSDTADILQNSAGNVAETSQSLGSGNIAFTDQGFVGGAGVGGDDNRAFTIQEGSSNISGIEQNVTVTGGDNLATVTQDGDGNVSAVTQDGDLLTATVNQLTDGNFSSVTQGGSGNSVVVNQ